MGLFPTDDPGYQAVYAEEAAMIDASETIAEALDASGLTQADLARMLRVSRSEITERLKGNRNITVRNLAATLHVLGGKLRLEVELPSTRTPEPSDPYSRWTRASLAHHHQESRDLNSLASLVGRP